MHRELQNRALPIRRKILLRDYDLTIHAIKEMAEDDLDILDIEHKKGFIILEGITVGVCDTCGFRYYSAEILHAVHDIATGAKPFERTEQIPVSHLPE